MDADEGEQKAEVGLHRDFLRSFLVLTIEKGIPIELAWAVENSTRWGLAWSEAKTPGVMIGIAAHVVTRKRLARTMSTVLKQTLFAMGDVRLACVLDSLRDLDFWAVSNDDVVRPNPISVFRKNLGLSLSDAVTCVYNCSMDEDTRDVFSTRAAASNVIGYVRNCGISHEQISGLIRRCLTVTISDLAAAGKRGWGIR